MPEQEGRHDNEHKYQRNAVEFVIPCRNRRDVMTTRGTTRQSLPAFMGGNNHV